MAVKLDYQLILCRATKQELCEIVYDDIKFTDRARDFNSLEFSVPYYDSGWEMNPDSRFDLVKGLFFVRMLIRRDSTVIYEEYFVITDPTTTSDNGISKTVVCYSMQYMSFNNKRLRSYEQTVVLYNASAPTNPSAGLLNYIVNSKLYGTWTVSYVSPSLASITRTWAYDSNSITEVLKDVEKQLDCYIVCNNVANTIAIYTADEYGGDMDLVLSDSNYITGISKSDKVVDMITRVSCYGKDNITMASYNPTGLPYVDNFSYAINNEIMSAELIAAINAYGTVKAEKDAIHAGYVTQRTSYTSDLLIKQAQLDALKADLAVIEDDLDILKDEHPNDTQPYAVRYVDKIAKDNEILAKIAEVTAAQGYVTNIEADISSLNTSLQYSDYFTNAQLAELNNFIFEKEISLNTVTSPEVLYEYAKTYVDRKAIPTSELEVNLLDLFSASAHKADWSKMINSCGNYVYIDCSDIKINYAQFRILQIEHRPKSESLTAVVSNADKTQKDLDYITTDVWQKSKQTANKMDVNQYDYKSYTKEKATVVRTGSAINTETTPIVAGNSTITKRGFMGTDIGSGGRIQVRGDKIIISTDDFATYNTLLSGNGMYLEDEDTTMRVVITPSYGFQLDQNVGTAENPIWKNSVYFDQTAKKYYFSDGTIYGSRFYAGTPDTPLGYLEMTSTGMKMYGNDGLLKGEMAIDQSDVGYPYFALGAGDGTTGSRAIFKKFLDGAWIGNSAPLSTNGQFTPAAGYNGIFFDFEESVAYVVHGTDVASLYTGEAIAKFG